MSRSVRGQGGAEGSPVLVECDPADVGATTRVRDVDQLSPPARREFIEAVDGSTRAVDVAGLSVGDVVRYTAYYRVV